MITASRSEHRIGWWERASASTGFDRIPTTLRRYVLAVGIAGPMTALTAAAWGYQTWTRSDLAWAVLLTTLAIIAERFPLHLTHKTNVFVSTAAYVVMLLILPPSLPGLLAMVAIATAQTLRRTAVVEGVFNVGQGALYVSLGALCLELTRDLPIGPPVSGFGSLGAIVVTASALHLANTGLVAGAAALQMGLNPLRVWTHNITLDLMVHVTLTALGTIAAVLSASEPLLLPFLALPAVLVYHAMRQTIRLRLDTHEALAALVEVIELRDPYTAGHSRRVAALARTLALRVGLTAEEADTLEHAGRVHDIGKAALDSAILSKASDLDDSEWRQIRMHPVHGANVVAKFAAYRDGVRAVRHHHERWDGTGYPDGLAGESIPLEARILAVADTLDALTSDRPYRQALSLDEAVDILRAGAGTQWDPRIVEAAVAFLREVHGELPRFRPSGLPPGAIPSYEVPEVPPSASSQGTPVTAESRAEIQEAVQPCRQ